MAEYGLTESGVNIKRLDVILAEMQDSLTKKWGVDVAQNPQSVLNVLLTEVADHLAELWELGQDVYDSQYPQSAEGEYLDGVGQFIGITRELDAPSYYHILCTGEEGTTLPDTVMISSDTNPVVYLVADGENTISRERFNKAEVKVVSLDGNSLSISLNGVTKTYTPVQNDTAATALAALAALVASPFSASIDSSTGFMVVTASDDVSVNSMVLSDNLTTETVGCVFTFATENPGDIYLPSGSINRIVTAVTGLRKVENVGAYIAGRLEETDTEFRQSYMDKIFGNSSSMTSSIKSAILEKCQGVTSAVVYENCGDTTDAGGRYPHSIEVVCDGGDSTKIAEVILATKAAGINTSGSTSVSVPTENGDSVTIKFSRPTYLTVWFNVTITATPGMSLPSGYAETIKGIILSVMEDIDMGGAVTPQSRMLPMIYDAVTGVGYVEIKMETGAGTPESYTKKNIYPTSSQRAVTDIDKIGVVLDE